MWQREMTTELYGMTMTDAVTREAQIHHQFLSEHISLGMSGRQISAVI